ncbi:unnamed protein product [Malus baccata var. baccata]
MKMVGFCIFLWRIETAKLIDLNHKYLFWAALREDFYQLFKEDELEQSTEVPIMFPGEPKLVYCEFDWELDELEEFTDNLIEEEELSADQKNEFKEFVKEKVREQKKSN